MTLKWVYPKVTRIKQPCFPDDPSFPIYPDILELVDDDAPDDRIESHVENKEQDDPQIFPGMHQFSIEQ